MARTRNAFFHPTSSPKETRYGIAYVASGCNAGQFHKLDGVFSAADITTLGSSNSGKPGYASAGDPKLNRVETGVLGRVYPVNKLAFYPEDDETTYRSIAAGAQVVYYTAGSFITDQYDQDPTSGVSGTGSKFGQYLKLTVSGWLTEEADGDTETAATVARTIELIEGGDDTQDRLHFMLIT